MPDDVRWTAKLPTLLIGLALIVAGLFATTRRAVIASIILIGLGAAFVSYSLTIKEWCALKGTTLGQSAWGSGFGASFDQCLKQKGWLSF